MSPLRKFVRRVIPLNARRAIGRFVEEIVFQYCKLIAQRNKGASKKGPVVVSGYLSRTFGIGRAGNYTIQGLQNGGYSPIAHDVEGLLRQSLLSNNALYPDQHGVWIAHLNAPEAIAAFCRLRPRQWKHRYRIGYWAYELPKAPDRWIEATALFDEIWAPSQFVAVSLKGAHCPVKVVPHYIPPLSTTTTEESIQTFNNRWGIRHNRYSILAAGDLRSNLNRKNLAGAVSIYRKAFPEAQDNVQLILKLNQSDADKNGVCKLKELTKGRSDIVILDESLTEADMNLLCTQSDLILSPHRSEGYGLLLAEALNADVPVLATGYSGNLEFMAGSPKLQLGFELTPVGEQKITYENQHSQCWADPDEAMAADQLARIRQTPELVRKDMTNAQTAIRTANKAWSSGRLL